MAEFKLEQSKSGADIWYKNGKRVAKREVPIKERRKLGIGKPLPEPEEPKKIPKDYVAGGTSIIEGEDGDDTDFIATLPQAPVDVTPLEENDNIENDIFAEDALPDEEDVADQKAQELPSFLTDKRCLFCGAYALSNRALGLKGIVYVVPLCDEHYMDKTVGETMQKLQIKLEGE